MFRRIEVRAPAGKLGLSVVDSESNEVRNVISKVDEESPLAGKVFPGDQIISLNGLDVHQVDALGISDIFLQQLRSKKTITIARMLPETFTNDKSMARNNHVVSESYQGKRSTNTVQAQVPSYSRVQYNENINKAPQITRNVNPNGILVDADIDVKAAPIQDQEPGCMQTPTRATPCCGCCCDYRRAVIIIDIIIILLEALVLILLPMGAFNQVLMVQDDDLVKTEMIFSGVSIATGLCSIFGAHIFNIWPVLVNVIWLVTGYIAVILYAIQWCNDFLDKYSSSAYYATCYVEPGAIISQGAVMLLWLYPHVGFIVQVKKGMLTKDNYVPQSCCCISNNAVADFEDQKVSPGVVSRASPPRMEQGIRQ